MPTSRTRPVGSTTRAELALGPVTLRRVANLVNLSTLAGWALARSRGVPLSPGPHGLWVAWGYPRAFPAPRASAVTVGDVVLVRDGAAVTAARRPRLLDHEARHAAQWACLPVVFLPLYAVASLWSLARTGHPAHANVFEVAAGLTDGGYRPGRDGSGGQVRRAGPGSPGRARRRDR